MTMCAFRGAVLALTGCCLMAAGATGAAAQGEALNGRVLVAVASTGGITGRVVADRTGEPLAGAVIEVREVSARVSADESGQFRLEGLRPGRYTLEVGLLGRSQGSERVEVRAGQLSEVEIALGLAPVALEALRVKLDRTEMVGARLTRVPGSAHVLNADKLSAQKLAFDDVHALLRQVPGVNLADEEGHGRRPNIGMRGTGINRSSKIALMEDGVLAAPAPYSSPAAYLFPVVGRMESIEVRKGSSQVKYGPWSTGGALNLVSTGIPTGLKGMLDVAGGEDGNRKLRMNVGGTQGRFGWLLHTYQLQTDGFKQLDAGGNTGFELQDYMVKLRLSSAPEARLYQDIELKLGLTDEASRETYLGLADADFDATPFRRYAGTQLDRLDTDAVQYQLRHFARLPVGVDLTTTLYRNDFARTWYKLDRMASGSLNAVLTDPAQAGALAVLRGANSADNALIIRSNAREYRSEGLQSVLGLQFHLLGSHALEFGARYHRDSEDRFQHEDAFRMQNGRMELTTAGAPGSQDNRVAEARALALFVEDRITVGSWTFTTGVRYEDIDFTSTEYVKADASRGEVVKRVENGVSVVVPGIGVSRLLGRHGQVFAGVHRGFGPPGPGADERTKPEESVNYELGGRIEAAGLSIQLAGFYNDYTNILGRATLSSGESGNNELFNGGSVLVKGIEAAAEYDLATGRAWGLRVPLRTSYTYTDGTFRSAFQSAFGEWGTVAVGDELPYLPRHQGYAAVGVDAPRWRVDLSAASSSAMRTRAGSGDLVPGLSTDAFTVLTLSGEVGVSSWTRLYASIQNLTDETYVVARRPAGARPGLPRTISLGLRATLQ
jgi:Fe(3+) dicitrate transport protein